MTPEQRLIRNIKAAAGPPQLAVYQGEVVAVDGETCTVVFASQRVEGVRLRASLAEVEEQLLVVPKVGSAVIVGSLSGDLAEAHADPLVFDIHALDLDGQSVADGQ